MRISEGYTNKDSAPLLTKPDMRSLKGARIVQVFWNTDMRNRFDGLAEIAKKNGIDVSDLKVGQFLVFINSEKTMITVYTANNIIASHRSTRGRIDERAIALIPDTFMMKGRLDYDDALRDTLVSELSKRQTRTLN